MEVKKWVNSRQPYAKTKTSVRNFDILSSISSKVIVIPVLSLLIGGCALLNNPYYYAYRRCATPFSRPCVVSRPGCRPSVSRCPTYGRSSSYGNAWDRALNTLHREAREERSFLSSIANAGRKMYQSAAKAEMNFYKGAAKAQMKAYKSAAKWMGLW